MNRSHDICKRIHDVMMRLRLKRIEWTTGIKLMDWQRDVVLNSPEDTVYSIEGMRGTGITVTAIFSVLLWRKIPIRIEEETRILRTHRGLAYLHLAIHDQEIRNHDMLLRTLQEYEKYALMCKRALIKVSHVLKR